MMANILSITHKRGRLDYIKAIVALIIISFIVDFASEFLETIVNDALEQGFSGFWLAMSWLVALAKFGVSIFLSLAVFLILLQRFNDMGWSIYWLIAVIMNPFLVPFYVGVSETELAFTFSGMRAFRLGVYTMPEVGLLVLSYGLVFLMYLVAIFVPSKSK